MSEHLFEQLNLSDQETNRTKSPIGKRKNNRIAKKGRKLWITFAKRFLDESILKQELTNSTEDCNLLIDNRDYILNCSTEHLIQNILKCFPNQNVIDDVFVLPSKTFIIIHCSSPSICTDVHQCLIDDNFVVAPVNVVAISDKVFNLIISKYSIDVVGIIELFNKKPDGLKVFKNFITFDEEKILIELASSCLNDPNNEKHVNKIKNRKAAHYGYIFDYQLNSIAFNDNPTVTVVDHMLPVQCQSILQRLYETGIITEMADQLTINHYDGFCGDHIPLHCDTHSMCSDWIASLSVGTDVVMMFDNPRTSEKALCNLPCRSIMLMTNEARYLWRHGILQTSFDLVPWNTTEMSQNEFSHERLALRKRGVRYSFTFRKIRPAGYVCKCSFPESCNNQQSSKPSLSRHLEQSKAEDLELLYVHKTYDVIAEHFSATRYGCWPRVVEFIQSLPRGSLLIDVGCGNGKYLSVDQDRIVSIGTDRSNNLLKICREKNFETFFDDCLNVDRTLRQGLFDAAICIAVIHHMANEERRLKALHSLILLLDIGGRLLVYVWAFEQQHKGKSSKYLRDSGGDEINKLDTTNNELSIHRNRSQFQQQDLFVPWTKSQSSANLPSTELRYYHVFREGELKSLIEKLPNGLVHLEQIYYDQGNWCAIIQRIK